MRPLPNAEISDGLDPPFDAHRAVIHALLPSHYLSENYKEKLCGYISDYLIAEITNEGSVRNFPSFSELLRVVSITNTELLNHTNVAGEVGV